MPSRCFRVALTDGSERLSSGEVPTKIDQNDAVSEPVSLFIEPVCQRLRPRSPFTRDLDQLAEAHQQVIGRVFFKRTGPPGSGRLQITGDGTHVSEPLLQDGLFRFEQGQATSAEAERLLQVPDGATSGRLHLGGNRLLLGKQHPIKIYLCQRKVTIRLMLVPARMTR